jgi:thiamine-phosphate pyrophosphorylase
MLDRFYLVVDTARWIERLVPLGVRLVQLRIKEQSEASIRHQVRDAMAICAEHECRLVVNDHWRLAIEEGCDYVHLGQEDLRDADVPAIRRAGLRFGVSTHAYSELARALGVHPDYIALGPIYPTVLKQMPWAPQGLGRIAAWKARVGDIPLVAIGGLTVERAAGALEAGADSAAVVSDIAQHPDPEARTLEWIAATRRQR